MLWHTSHTVRNLAAGKYVFYADEISPDRFDAWPDSIFSAEQQQGADLGRRMQHAFSVLFGQGYEKICIIGSDCMTLCEGDVEEAFAALDEHDVVIGPSADGGYYLLGMKKMNEALFENKAWSTDDVLRSTIQDIRTAGCSYHLLRVQSDIDTEDDWRQYLAMSK